MGIIGNIIMRMLGTPRSTAEPTLYVGKPHIEQADATLRGPEVSDGDIVMPCGCVTKWKKNKKYSTHTSTIKCAKHKAQDAEIRRMERQ